MPTPSTLRIPWIHRGWTPATDHIQGYGGSSSSSQESELLIWRGNLFKYTNFMHWEPRIDTIANEYKTIDSHSR